MDETTTELLATTSSDAMREWSEQRRKDFVKLYEQRANTAAAILARTAQKLHESAVRRYILPQKARFTHDIWQYQRCDRIGDRKWEDIEQIASKRADAIFNQLPQVKKALEVVDHDTFELMEKKDKLLKKAQEKLKMLRDLSEPMALSDVDQKMTIADFRKYADEREAERKKLVRELNDLGETGAQLEAKIHKGLFKGIPGLKEAVEVAIDAQLARIEGFEQLKRRVQEQVLFGDSEAAQQLLQHFKEDEVELDDDVKQQIQAALAKVNLMKKTKALPRKS